MYTAHIVKTTVYGRDETLIGVQPIEIERDEHGQIVKAVYDKCTHRPTEKRGRTRTGEVLIELSTLRDTRIWMTEDASELYED